MRNHEQRDQQQYDQQEHNYDQDHSASKANFEEHLQADVESDDTYIEVEGTDDDLSSEDLDKAKEDFSVSASSVPFGETVT